MLNYIWFGLMAIALVVAIFNGTAPALTKAAVDSARVAVEISLGLVGIMTLWLGIMRIAEKAGLIALLGRGLRPISRLLFPEIPPEHPAIGAMLVAVAANMLGLNNAATPLGIKAMEELEELNPYKETASNAMVTFMVINTSGIQFIPATIIGVLAAAGGEESDVDHRSHSHLDDLRSHRRGERGEAPAAVLSSSGCGHEFRRCGN